MSAVFLFLRRNPLVLAGLLLAMAGTLGYLAQRYHWQWDVTLNGRHTLSQASHDVISRMPGKITIAAYASLQDPQHGDLRQPIRDFVARYQRIRPDMVLKFVDPAHEPERARAAGIQVNGELVVIYRDRSEHLATLNEQDFTNVLMRLSRDGERLALFLTGHGERRLDGTAPHDLGEFGRQLNRKGFRIEPLNLAAVDAVPTDVAVLLLTWPRTAMHAAEVDRIRRYLSGGGNLLWLLEPGPLRELRPVAEALSLSLLPGTVIDPAAQGLNLPPSAAIATRYGMHPATAGFDLVTVFPNTRPVGVNDEPAWHATPLVEVAERGWVETDAVDANAIFNAGRDMPGPVVTALALEREGEEGRQRAVVIGGSDFLSNSHLGNGGNLDLGINLANWVAGDDQLVTIQPRNTLDASLNLGRAGATGLALDFLLVLPLTFFVVAVIVWRRRNA